MRMGCDVGGTFTDLVAIDPRDGALRVGKALNSGAGPRDGVLGALEAAGVAPDAVTAFAHGTTTITNLLIERTGARVGLVTTRGFRDVLEIQLSFRSRTFDARYHKTPALVPRERRAEIGGRIDRDGRETEPLDIAEIDVVLAQLIDDGVEVLAVALYNAYANPAHEQAVARAWQRLAGGRPVTCATDVDPRIGEYERTSTAVLNAAAIPHMRAYADQLDATIAGEIRYLHSAGGVVPVSEARARPIQLALSGPAGGVIAGRRIAAELGLDRAITLDMGGTSCDVCLIDAGSVRERASFDVAWGVPARIRCLDINSVGAGGGSIAWQDAGGAMQVGPRSAGARPGPCCYGRGGAQPTVTDANLVLGILDAEGLLGGELPLDAGAAEAALAGLGLRFDRSLTDIATAIHHHVNATMAQAVREITVRHGIDPRGCALLAFGGAGPQHAAGVAAQLGLDTAVIPANSSVLSALGILGAELRASAARTILAPVARLGEPDLEHAFKALEAEASSRLGSASGDGVMLERWAGLRYVDQWHEVALTIGDIDSLATRFEDEHERRFGTRLGDTVEVVDVWVIAIAPAAAPLIARNPEHRPIASRPGRVLHLAGCRVPVLEPAAIVGTLLGPALIQEHSTVAYLPAGARAERRDGHLVLSGLAAPDGTP